MAKKRVDITIDDDVHEWAKEHAKEKRTTLSALVNKLLFELMQKEEAK